MTRLVCAPPRESVWKMRSMANPSHCSLVRPIFDPGFLRVGFEASAQSCSMDLARIKFHCFWFLVFWFFRDFDELILRDFGR